MFGRFRGSMPITTVGAATLYGAISGSTAATVAALGPLVYPPLRKAGYNEKFSTGVITSSGALANIIPPSIAMILYGAAAEQSVVKLFAAGVLPGLVIAALMSAYIYYYARRQDIREGEPFRWAVFSHALREGGWAIGAPVIVFGGIYAGVFSPTEAAGAACVYAILVTMGLQREISWREFWDVAVTSMYLTAQIFLIVAVAGSEVVGCLAALQADNGMRPETTHLLHLGLHLREAYRGLGIGTHLLDYAIAWAVEKGFKKLEANIFTTNKHSLGMFTKAGFAEEGVRKNRIQVGRELVNEVLMGKVL